MLVVLVKREGLVRLVKREELVSGVRKKRVDEDRSVSKKRRMGLWC